MIVECELQHLHERCFQRGYKLEEAMPCVCERQGDRIKVDTSHPAYPAFRRTGPGTVLKAVLRSLGHKQDASCSCRDRAIQMNKWGVEGCRENMGTITEWLSTEASVRGIPHIKAAFPLLVDFCCKRAQCRDKYKRLRHK